MIFRYWIILFAVFGFLPDTHAQSLAFPGAEGFGRWTSGGRGGAVYEVTNLNDSGTGSLRAAIAASGKRTIVFKVSGNIALASELKITNGDLTIAGQTAPGDGICVKNYTLNISADNVIIRYIRFRTGDEATVAGTTREYDGAWGRDHKNIILDHCSFSWGNDEVASFYDNTNFTMQWCVISESFYHSTHPKGDHGYGGIWGGIKASFHHNLLAHHTSRNPRFCGARFHPTTASSEIVNFRNNVIYNWAGNSTYGGETGNMNMINNYYKAGPATKKLSSSVQYRIVSPSDSLTSPVFSKWYIAGNLVDNDNSSVATYVANVNANNWNGGVQPDIGTSYAVSKFQSTTPIIQDTVTTETATEAFNSVMASVGASFPKRDTVDARIVYETKNRIALYGGTWGSGAYGIIDSQSTVGGYPVLNSTTAPTDTDHDGMPDVWESLMGLNSNDASDRNGDLDSDGYTNLEEYMNSIETVLYPVTGIRLTGDSVVAIGTKARVWAAITPAYASNPSITWSLRPEDASKASVIDSSGVCIITPKTTGIIVVIAQSVSTSGVTATMSVRITDFVTIQTLAFEGDTVTSLENSIRLTPVYTPSSATHKNLTWSLRMQDISLVSITDSSDVCVVTPKTTGRVLLTASTTDGSEIKVSKGIWVLNLTISGDSVTTIGKQVNVSAGIEPSSNPYFTTVNWEYSDGHQDFASIVDSSGIQVVSPLAVGKFMMTAQIAEATMIKAIHPIRVKLPTQVNQEFEKELMIWPNPVDDRLFFKYEKPFSSLKVQLVNSMGEIVKTEVSYGKPASINCSRLSQGMWLFQIYINGNVLISKIIIKQ